MTGKTPDAHVSGEKPVKEGWGKTAFLDGPDWWKPGEGESTFKYASYVSVARRPCQKSVFEKAFPPRQLDRKITFGQHWSPRDLVEPFTRACPKETFSDGGVRSPKDERLRGAGNA
jgi:hypothetical protein